MKKLLSDAKNTNAKRRLQMGASDLKLASRGKNKMIHTRR